MVILYSSGLLAVLYLMLTISKLDQEFDEFEKSKNVPTIFQKTTIQIKF